MIMKSLMILPFMVFVICCGMKPTFNEDELMWLSVYDEGDTLIFKSDSGVFDTTIIIAKEIFYPDYNPIESHGTYLPQYGVIWYKNANLRYHEEGDRLITLIKKEPDKKTFLAISFKYSNFIFLDISGENLDKFLKGNLYEFESPNERVDLLEPKIILWDKDKGIVQYVTGDSSVWRRVN